MPKRSLRKYLPSPARLMRVNGFKRFGNLLDRRELWHISRTSIARATAIGLFCSMIPLPGQMFIAVFLAIRFSANVPLSFMLIFVTNPITMPVIYLGAYLFGSALLGAPILDVTAVDWLNPLSAEFLGILPAFILGCAVMGLIAAFLGYFIADGLWRLRISQRVTERARNRLARRRATKR